MLVTEAFVAYLPVTVRGLVAMVIAPVPTGAAVALIGGCIPGVIGESGPGIPRIVAGAAACGVGWSVCILLAGHFEAEEAAVSRRRGGRR
jgi:hypothetical protein